MIGCLIYISKLGIIGSGFCSIKNFESIIRTSSIEYEINLGLDESDGIRIFSIEHQLNGQLSEKNDSIQLSRMAILSRMMNIFTISARLSYHGTSNINMHSLKRNKY